MLEINQPPPGLDVLKRYAELGFKLIFWPRDLGKAPSDPAWPKKALDGIYTVDSYHEGMNVGVLLGAEISPGKFLIDVDFDWQIQPILAARIFEKTGFQFGHRSKKFSHLFYTQASAAPSAKYLDPISKDSIVEFRCTKQDGSLGLQTVVPPSVHSPSGEAIEFDEYENIFHDENNRVDQRVKLYATAYILFKRFQHQQFHHEQRLATIGFLLESGLVEDDVQLVGDALARACGNDVSDVRMVVHTTVAKFTAGKIIKGRSNLASLLGEDGNQIIVGLTKILGGSWFITDGKDKISSHNAENIRIALDKMKVTLSFNEFSQQHIMSDGTNKGPIQDPHLNRLWLEIDSKYHFRPSKDLFQTVILDETWQHKYHPVKEYLNGLTWDGTPRLDTWLVDTAGAADSEYHRAISSMLLIAGVRRIYQPGCKFDELVILESSQGRFKSSALKLLCPNEEWFSDDLPLDADSKIIIEKTRGKWILEAAELAGMKAYRIEHLKALLARSSDNARMAYDRMISNLPRQWIVVGTTNSYVYLKDSTGNRRFWPIRVNEFNLRLLASIRDQLWAEAVVREKNGESIRLSPHLYKVAELQQERRLETDPWEDTIDEFFVNMKRPRITSKELWSIVNIPTEYRTRDQQGRLSAIMTRKGFRKAQVRSKAGGAVEKGWTKDNPEDKLKDPNLDLLSEYEDPID